MDWLKSFVLLQAQKNGQPFEVKSSDVIAEESKVFEDTVKSLDGEEYRPKTVLDDVLTCLETAHNIVMRVYSLQGMTITDNAAVASYLHYECTQYSTVPVPVPTFLLLLMILWGVVIELL